MIKTRREFLGNTLGATAAVALASLKDDWLVRVARADVEARGKSAGANAANESYWTHIQQAFDLDRSIINLNNGGCAPAPRFVLDAQRRHIEFTNIAPVRTLWSMMDPQCEQVRSKLAHAFGCSPDEMAITRNASESLQIALNGIDMKPGDEFLTTLQDYPRMITTLKQRKLREGIEFRQIKIPSPAKSQDELFEAIEKAVTPRTKAILVCHTIFLNGQIMPVKRICAMARERGIWSVIDGAHAFAQFAFRGGDIGCDVYGVSLHKWLTAPIGTGFLYVRKDRIKDIWPMQASEHPKSDDIRKFEEIGTHPDAGKLAIAEALLFYQGIGPERKEARLRYLRDYWARRLMKNPKVKMHTSLEPEHSCAIGLVEIEGIEPAKIMDYLWEKHKIIVAIIKHDDFQGLRISANVYTTTQELDTFCEVMEKVAESGIPTAESAGK